MVESRLRGFATFRVGLRLRVLRGRIIRVAASRDDAGGQNDHGHGNLSRQLSLLRLGMTEA